MLTVVKNQIKISFLSMKYALMKEMVNKANFIMNVFFMILNNAAFIVQWVILFSIKDDFGGYQLTDVLLLWGFASTTYGISRLFFKNAFNISDLINKGKLDSFLVQPKNVLLSLTTTDVKVSAIGDIIYGYIVLIIYGITPINFLLFTLLSILGGLILVSISVMFGSLSFWFSKTDLLADTINSMATNFSTYPETIFNGAIKWLFATIVPIAYTAYIPLEVMINFNGLDLLMLIGITALFITIAFIVFYQGLKKYSSSNLMIARV